MSKINMRSVNITPTVKKPVSPNQGAWRLRFPWLSNSPKEADPAGRPKPRKSNAVSEVIAPLNIKGKNVSAAVIALGNT